MSASGQEALPDVRELSETFPNVLEWSGDPLRCPGVVGLPSHMSGSGERPSWMSGSGLESLSDVRECSEGPPGCPGGPLGCLEVFERLSQMSGSGLEALSEAQESLPNV